jgi:hypothetical protein
MPTDGLHPSAGAHTFRAVKEDIDSAVAAWLPAFGLPPEQPGVKDLRGRVIALAKFTDDETCRFFFPRRTVLFQQRMVRAIGRIFMRRGAKLSSVQLISEDYARWCDAHKKTDTPELRFHYATRPPTSEEAEQWRELMKRSQTDAAARGITDEDIAGECSRPPE